MEGDYTLMFEILIASTVMYFIVAIIIGCNSFVDWYVEDKKFMRKLPLKTWLLTTIFWPKIILDWVEWN